MNSKKKNINNWTKYFLGLCSISGMLLFTACNNDNRNQDTATGEGFGYGVDAEREDDLLNAQQSDTMMLDRTTNATDTTGEDGEDIEGATSSHGLEGSTNTSTTRIGQSLNSNGHNIRTSGDANMRDKGQENQQDTTSLYEKDPSRTGPNNLNQQDDN